MQRQAFFFFAAPITECLRGNRQLFGPKGQTAKQVRLSVGIESLDDLLADLNSALDTA